VLKVIVVGSGFGGLAAAALLSVKGAEVQVFEKNEMPGGRASVHTDKGYTFDMGPSWYLMPDIFEKFFANFGKKPEDLFELKQLDPSYRIYFGSEGSVDIHSDIEENYRLFDSFEEGGADSLKLYLASAKEKYELSVNEMLYKEYRSYRDLFNWRMMKEGRKLKMFQNLDKFASKYFKSKEAKRVVEYSIGFLGGAPDNTPSFYHMMSHIDITMGVFYPEGGMRKVADVVYKLALEHGAEFQFQEPVKEILFEGKKAVGVRTEKGTYNADLVIVNADYAHAEMDLLPPERRTYSQKYWDKRVLAPSALVAYVGVNKKFDAFDHHTLFLDDDWEHGFEELFNPRKAAWPHKPSYYVNVPSRTDSTAAPEGCDTLFILVPLAPGLQDTPELRETFLEKILDDLEEKIGEDIRPHIETKRIFALEDFRTRYNALRGTSLGLAHTLRQTAIWRPSHKSKKADNLYYTGGYTHPGIGVPMVLIASTIVAEEIAKEQSISGRK